MKTLFRDVGAALAVVVGLVGFEEARDSITAGEIRAHLFLLSSDSYEGRAPGTRGADLAARYIQSRFMAAGLQPIHDSYVQEVPVVGVTTRPETVALDFEHETGSAAAAYPTDAVVWPGSQAPRLEIAAELVFVGYGIDAPEWDWDDFGDADVAGKVLLFLVGDPPAPPEEPDLFAGRDLTYYGRWSYKLEEARRRGATGALVVHRPDAAGYGWDVVMSSWTGERLTLQESGEATPTPLQGWLSGAFTADVLAQAGLDLDELAVRAARRDFRPVPTGITVRGRLESTSRRVRTHNVVGYLPGSDSAAAQEVILFTSHYDHLGIGAPVDGDSIYNGAYDNASGIALLLEVADAFARVDRPRRGVVFIATTGEEAGQLGARHYVRRPLFPLHRTAAAFNIDGANLWGETDDVIALGSELSSLGESLRSRAARMGIQVRPDPVPERGTFFRSDQFPFARAGVPVLNIQHGLRFRGRPSGWGDALMERWLELHYHKPSDEFDPAADLSGAVQQGRLLFSVGYDVANADSAPRWHDDAPYHAARDSTAP
ncbi:MAG: M20/M25/M40 family metallo-hydrolase [Gemmatimonadota bacterium]|jgi:Zn-dependent M28 family amino/carboxypeptidase